MKMQDMKMQDTKMQDMKMQDMKMQDMKMQHTGSSHVAVIKLEQSCNLNISRISLLFAISYLERRLLHRISRNYTIRYNYI